MPGVFDDVLRANERYAAGFDGGGISGKAAKGLAVVTCIDSRIEPLQMLGLRRGDAKILRNAGARVTDDVLRTLVVAANLLDVRRIALVTHTDCAMGRTTDDALRETLGEQYGPEWVTRRRFLTTLDPIAREREDLRRLLEEPLLPDGTVIGAYRFDVATGRLEESGAPVEIDAAQRRSVAPASDASDDAGA